MLLLVAFLFAVNIQAQNRPYKIGYELTMPNPATYLFEVKMTIETTIPEAAIDLWMPPYEEGLEFVGMKLSRSEAARPSGKKITNYKIEELSKASVEAIDRRKAWLSGK